MEIEINKKTVRAYHEALFIIEIISDEDISMLGGPIAEVWFATSKHDFLRKCKIEILWEVDYFNDETAPQSNEYDEWLLYYSKFKHDLVVLELYQALEYITGNGIGSYELLNRLILDKFIEVIDIKLELLAETFDDDEIPF